MSDAIYPHDANRVCNLINHSIITHSDSPVILASDEFSRAGRSWIESQLSDCPDDTVMNVVRQPSEVFLSRAFEVDSIHAPWTFFLRGILLADGNGEVWRGPV